MFLLWICLKKSARDRFSSNFVFKSPIEFAFTQMLVLKTIESGFFQILSLNVRAAVWDLASRFQESIAHKDEISWKMVQVYLIKRGPSEIPKKNP